MERRIKSNALKKVFMVLVAFASMVAVPVLVMVPFMRLVQPARVLDPELLAEGGGAFDLERLREVFAGHQVKRLKSPDLQDYAIVTGDQRQYALALSQPGVELMEDLRFLHRIAQVRRSKAGVEMVRESKSGFSLRAVYADSSEVYTKGMEGRHQAVAQIAGRRGDRLAAELEAMPLLVRNPEISDLHYAIADNKVIIILAFIAVFFMVWFATVCRLTAWATRVKPDPAATPLPEEELKAKLLGLNELKVPFQIADRGDDLLESAWKLDKQWSGILAKYNVKRTVVLKMKLHASRHAVAVVETQRQVVEDQGLFSLRKSKSFFRGISLVDYEHEKMSGLSFEDGRFKVTGFDYTFNIQELKNPLIELLHASGWTWEPHVLWV